MRSVVIIIPRIWTVWVNAYDCMHQGNISAAAGLWVNHASSELSRIIYIRFKTLNILVKIEMEHIVNFPFQDILMFIVYFITNIMYVLMYI